MLNGVDRNRTLCKNERPKRGAMGCYQSIITQRISQPERGRQTPGRFTKINQWYPVGMPNGSTLGGYSAPIFTIPDLPSVFPANVQVGNVGRYSKAVGARFEKTRENRYNRMLYRRLFRKCQKRGLDIGKTKRGKGTKIMAIADAHGLPIAIRTNGANTHEVKLVEKTIDARFLKEKPKKIIGDLAYDSDPLDKKLKKRNIELIAPHKSNRKKKNTQDKRKLRRYCRRWKIERLFAWIQNFRRCVVRYDFHALNYLGFIQFVCILILAKQF